MKAFYEFGLRQLAKKGEELCGDSAAFSVKPDWATLVLSDGLGSGVKASILATLTTRIATRMLDEGLPLEEVVTTVSETLPICSVRKIAYSTFTMAQLFSDCHAKLMEMDSPPAFFIRNNAVRNVPSSERTVDSKRIREYSLKLRPGDWIVFVSDGVINAGIGASYPLGWGWESVAAYLEGHIHESQTAEDLAEKLAGVVRELYSGSPGDDVTIAVVKVRRKRFLTILAGPPVSRSDDAAVVKMLASSQDRKVVCGGTTATIVARELGRRVNVDLETATDEVPASAQLEGVDLVTEGVLTLTKVLEILHSGAASGGLKLRPDGAARLALMMRDADSVRLMIGRAMNPAHQNPDLPRSLGIKTQVTQMLGEELRRAGKEVEIVYF